LKSRGWCSPGGCFSEKMNTATDDLPSSMVLLLDTFAMLHLRAFHHAASFASIPFPVFCFPDLR
jgi:hypothetical protein